MNRVLGMSLEGGKEEGIGGNERVESGESMAVRYSWVESSASVLVAVAGA